MRGLRLAQEATAGVLSPFRILNWRVLQSSGGGVARGSIPESPCEFPCRENWRTGQRTSTARPRPPRLYVSPRGEHHRSQAGNTNSIASSAASFSPNVSLGQQELGWIASAADFGALKVPRAERLARGVPRIAGGGIDRVDSNVVGLPERVDTGGAVGPWIAHRIVGCRERVSDLRQAVRRMRRN